MPTTRRTKKPANAAFLDKEPAASHQAFADFITETTGHLVPVGDVALIQRLYPLYLKSPAVQAVKRAEKEQREREAAARAAAKAERLKERLAAIEAQRRKLLDELGIDGQLEGQDAPVLSLVVPAETEGVEDDEPQTVVLAESEDDFVEAEEAEEDGDDDLWDDDGDEEVEDF